MAGMSSRAVALAALAVLCAAPAPAEEPPARAPLESAADLALREAVRAGDAAGVRAAAQAGGHPDQTVKLGVSLLQRAVEAGQAEVAVALLEAGARVDLPSSLGETPLHAAVGHGDLELVRLLLGAGADPNARMKFGLTPLLIAAEGDRAEIACRLIEAGARPDLTGKYQVSPLHLAARRGALATARVLLEAGADPLARDQDGDTAYDLAARLERTELLALLGPLTPPASRRVPADPDAPVAELGAVDFRDRGYRLQGGESVRVRGGVASPAMPGGVEVVSTTVLLGRLGEPAEERAAVLLRWKRAERGPFATLLLYGLDAGGRPVELARLAGGEGDGGAILGFRFESGELVVTHAPVASGAREEVRYRWTGRDLIPAGPAGHRPAE